MHSALLQPARQDITFCCRPGLRSSCHRAIICSEIFLCTTSRWLIYGETGVGKTLFALELAGAVASGKPFLAWEGIRRARVMYLDGEMPAETFKERMQLVADPYGSSLELFGYNRDVLVEGEMPPLNTEAGEKWLRKELDLIKPDLVIFDSIMWVPLRT
jgi:RecA-family ATPase